VCCSVLQCVAVCCIVWLGSSRSLYVRSRIECDAVCFSVLQCVAVCCIVLLGSSRSLYVRSRIVAVCCSVLQCVAVCCGVLQCVAVYFSVLHSFVGVVQKLTCT